MSKVLDIVHVENGCYDQGFGSTEDDECLGFYGNYSGIYLKRLKKDSRRLNSNSLRAVLN